MPHNDTSVEPWLRGTHHNTPAISRAVLHALDLTQEDFDRWVWPLSQDLLEEQPLGLPSVAFQARHIARSLDRLLTYAEGNQLSTVQRNFLATEDLPAVTLSVHDELQAALRSAAERIIALPLDQVEAPRYVGTARLPVTLAGLLTHLADHTQRHAGQAVTTAKILLAIHRDGATKLPSGT